MQPWGQVNWHYMHKEQGQVYELGKQKGIEMELWMEIGMEIGMGIY